MDCTDGLLSAESVFEISAGGSHSVALLGNHVAATWGRGEEGQLGHGKTDDVTVPTVVSLLRDARIRHIACGAQHTVAVGEDDVYSWGWGDFGRLGHGHGDDMVLPSPIAFFSGMRIKQLACGDSHTLVLNDAGVLYSFGRGQNGQLGLGNSNDSLQPQLVGAFWGQVVEGIAAGSEYSMALTEDGQIFAFGWGRYGNLGDGHCQDRFKPTPVCGLSGVRVRRVQCGWRHSAVTSDDGRVFTFGWNKFGQLGHGGKSENCSTAMQVMQLADVNIVSVSCGWRHSMAADDQGKVYAWGWNKFGQLGLNDLEDRMSPVVVSSLVEEGHRVATLSCGWRHSMALTDGGLIFTWGRGVNGQLGHGRQEDLSVPTLVDPGLFRASAALTAADDSSDDSGLRVPDCNDQEAADTVGCVPLVPQRSSLVELDATCTHKRNRVFDKADDIPFVKHSSLDSCELCS